MCNITSEMLFVIYRSLECTRVQPIDVVQNNSQDLPPLGNIENPIICKPLQNLSKRYV